MIKVDIVLENVIRGSRQEQDSSKVPQRPELGNPSTYPFVSLVEHDEQGVGSSRIASKDPQSPRLVNPSTCPLCVRREGVGGAGFPQKIPKVLDWAIHLLAHS